MGRALYFHSKPLLEGTGVFSHQLAITVTRYQFKRKGWIHIFCVSGKCLNQQIVDDSSMDTGERTLNIFCWSRFFSQYHERLGDEEEAKYTRMCFSMQKYKSLSRQYQFLLQEHGLKNKTNLSHTGTKWKPQSLPEYGKCKINFP